MIMSLLLAASLTLCYAVEGLTLRPETTEVEIFEQAYELLEDELLQAALASELTDEEERLGLGRLMQAATRILQATEAAKRGDALDDISLFVPVGDADPMNVVVEGLLLRRIARECPECYIPSSELLGRVALGARFMRARRIPRLGTVTGPGGR